MRIRLYQEPSGGGIGGSELSAAVFAHALRGRHEIELIHHRSDLTRAELAAFAEVDLDGVDVRYVPRPDRANWFPADAPPWRLGREMRRWKADLSKGCDLFVTATHDVPPFNVAPSGAMWVHFPCFDRPASWPCNLPPGRGLEWVKNRVRRMIHDRLWHERMAGYQIVAANSGYGAMFTRSRWEIDCGVLYPPVRTGGAVGPKEKVIAVLGRFHPMKRTLELVRLFLARAETDFAGWHLVCAGTVGKAPDDQDYLCQVREAVAKGPVSLLVDAPAAEVRGLLARASVFWHGAGFGVDPRTHPHLLEHFGLATAEAMAAGSVPVVPNRGGQPEIVRHGEDGFLCDEPEQLVAHTTILVRDPNLRERMGVAARIRAEVFSLDRFVQNVRTWLAPLTGGES